MNDHHNDQPAGTLSGRAVLVTGANRGIGRALVDEALRQGAARVYAGSRQHLGHPDPRVLPLRLDVTSSADIQHAVQSVDRLDVLVNNAGIALYDDLSDTPVIEQHLAVNLFGPLHVTQAFTPLLSQAGGAVVNNLSVNALAPLALIPAYSVSKAAAFSLTQSLRALLAPAKVSVHAVLTGIVDTDMSRGVDVPKARPDDVAGAIFKGLARGDEEIFPDPMSRSFAEAWPDGPAKTLERQYFALAAAVRDRS